MCYVCVLATDGKDGRRERGVQGCFGEDDGIRGAGGDVVYCGRHAHVGVVEPGEEESVGRYGWGARNREGRSLVELVARNGLAVASSFFQKRESHKITHRSGQHKTESYLVIVRKQQLWKIKDCKAVAGELVTTQHKPVV